MAKHAITFDQLASWKPCELEKHKKLFASDTSLSVSQALSNGANVSDILWVAGKLKLTTECVIFAVRCVEQVVHLNIDPRVQKAIDAAKNCVTNTTTEAYGAARAAAYGAYGAARAAAYANWAADYAGYAVDLSDVFDVSYAPRKKIEKFQKALLIELFS
jgi:hypothetical protein